MGTIKQWVITVSTVSIISGILISVLPKSTQKTLFKSIVSVLMIYAFLLPIVKAQKIKFNIDDYLSDNYRISNDANEYALLSIVSSAEKAIENLLDEEAEKQKINCKFICKCEVTDDAITVKKLTVKPEQNKFDVKKIYEIADSFGINTEVIVFEGENNEH